VQDKLTQVVEDYLRGQGMELIEMSAEHLKRGLFIRLVIDRPGHVTIEDCVLVHKELGWILKTEGMADEDLRLEVGSPGPRRKLRIPADFERVTGEPVRLVLRRPVNGLNVVKGTLKQATAGHVIIESDGMNLTIRMDDIKRANLWR